MVLIHLKPALGGAGGGGGGDDGFLIETTASTPVDDLVASVVEVHNARIRSRLVADAVAGLADRGVANCPEEEEGGAGTDEGAETGPNRADDPSGRRTGNPPDPDLAGALKREAESLLAYVDKDQVKRKVAITMEGIRERIERVRDAVGAAYPGGLPDRDVVRVALDDDACSVEWLASTTRDGGGSGSVVVRDAKDASLWTCSKEFRRGDLVSDRLGSTNEKTRVIAKLTAGAGSSNPPAREPVVSESERDAMAAFYFKRQEELKRLAEADEDDYLNSEWADPKGMKRSLQGLGDVMAPGLRF